MIPQLGWNIWQANLPTPPHGSPMIKNGEYSEIDRLDPRTSLIFNKE